MQKRNTHTIKTISLSHSSSNEVQNNDIPSPVISTPKHNSANIEAVPTKTIHRFEHSKENTNSMSTAKYTPERERSIDLSRADTAEKVPVIQQYFDDNDRFLVSYVQKLRAHLKKSNEKDATPNANETSPIEVHKKGTTVSKAAESASSTLLLVVKSTTTTSTITTNSTSQSTGKTNIFARNDANELVNTEPFQSHSISCTPPVFFDSAARQSKLNAGHGTLISSFHVI